MNDMGAIDTKRESVAPSLNKPVSAAEGQVTPSKTLSSDTHPADQPDADLVVAQPKFAFSAKPLDVDPRDSQVRYLVQVENPGKTRLRILSVRAFAPEGAKVQRIVETSKSDQLVVLNKIYSQLSTLLTEYLITQSKDYKATVTVAVREILDAALSTSRSPFGLAAKLVSGGLSKSLAQALNFERAWRIDVTSVEQGRLCFQRFLEPNAANDQLRCNVFNSKLEEARRLENIIADSENNSYAADLEPGEIYSSIYIFNCRRTAFNPRSYTFSFDCTYASYISSGNTSSARHFPANVTAAITPSPIVLNLVAVGSAVLGAGLKMAMALTAGTKSVTNSDAQAEKADGFAQLLQELTTLQSYGTVISAMITALLFFNIYDSMAIGGKLKFGSGWRSALVVGGLSGLVTEKVVKALQALLA